MTSQKKNGVSMYRRTMYQVYFKTTVSIHCYHFFLSLQFKFSVRPCELVCMILAFPPHLVALYLLQWPPDNWSLVQKVQVSGSGLYCHFFSPHGIILFTMCIDHFPCIALILKMLVKYGNLYKCVSASSLTFARRTVPLPKLILI